MVNDSHIYIVNSDLIESELVYIYIYTLSIDLQDQNALQNLQLWCVFKGKKYHFLSINTILARWFKLYEVIFTMKTSLFMLGDLDLT